MNRKVVLGALALALIWLYGYLLVVAFGYASAVPVPGWWRDAFGHDRVALWMWILPFDLLVTVVVSAPFALIIARYFRRTWLLLALAASGLLASSNFAGLSDTWRLVDGPYIGPMVMNTLRVLVVLPFLTWLARRLPSNYRLERP